MYGDQIIDHLSLAAAHALHVDAHGTRSDAELGAAADQRRHLPAVDDVLARQAGDVRARTADQPALDDRAALAGLRQSPCEVFPGLAAAEDQVIDVLYGGHEAFDHPCSPLSMCLSAKCWPNATRAIGIVWGIEY